MKSCGIPINQILNRGLPLGGLWQYSTYPTPNATNAPQLSEITSKRRRPLERNPTCQYHMSSAPDGEWIELYNEGATDIDLNAWSIIDGMGECHLSRPRFHRCQQYTRQYHDSMQENVA